MPKYITCDTCEASFVGAVLPRHRGFRGDICPATAESDARAMRARLASIQVLYRAPHTMALYGLPYRMREGQSPRNILDRFRGDWIWLGSPGWWGNLTKAEQEIVTEFLAIHADDIPDGPCEWSSLALAHGC